MRLTYRTVRVLMAIAELPGGSNREVAERAGIVDQGQISKMLTRLEYQGLIVNRDAAQHRARHPQLMVADRARRGVRARTARAPGAR